MRKPGTQIRIPNLNTLQGEGEGVFMVRGDFWWRHGTGHVVQLFILFFSPPYLPIWFFFGQVSKKAAFTWLAALTRFFSVCLSPLSTLQVPRRSNGRLPGKPSWVPQAWWSFESGIVVCWTQCYCSNRISITAEGVHLPWINGYIDGHLSHFLHWEHMGGN